MKAQTTASQNQEKICRDIVKNPKKAILSDVTYSEAKQYLTQMLGYTQKEIRQLEKD